MPAPDPRIVALDRVLERKRLEQELADFHLVRHCAAVLFAKFGRPKTWKHYARRPGKAQATMSTWFTEWEKTPARFPHARELHADLPALIACYRAAKKRR